MEKKRVRLRLLNDQKFQLSFMAYFALIAVFMNGIVYLANWTFFKIFIRQVQQLSLPPEHMLNQFVVSQQEAMQVIFVLTSIFIVSASLLAGLLISHRVAGPLIHLKNHLQAIKEGKAVPKLGFRKGDYFQDIAVLINEAFEKKSSQS